MAFHRTFHTWLVPLLFLFLFFSILESGAGAMTVEEEKKLGEKVFLEIEKNVEFVRDLTLQTYLDRMGHSLVAQVGPTSFEFKFHLIKASEPNAYAIPGGYIFVTTGLIVLTESEHELAGVLSHEISHVMARHVAQMIERSKRFNIATIGAIIASVLIGGGGKGSEAGVAMAMATAEAVTLKYTRENEVDADQKGLQYMVKAGYDPKGLITFLNKINKLSLTSSAKLPAYLLTHPITENRISLLENLLQIGPGAMGPFRSMGNFRKIRARVFVEEREPHLAITHFQSLVDADPQDVDGYYGLGLAYGKAGRLDKSAEVFQKAHALDPKDPDILRDLGIANFLSGKLDLAIESLEAMHSMSRTGGNQNEDLLSLYYLGRGYQERKDFARALPFFLKVQKERPEFVDVGEKGLSHFNFGKYFKLRGERSNALLHFRKAFELLEKERPEKAEAQREIKELTGGK